MPLFAATVLPTQIRTLICRVTGAIMQLETCCPSALEEETAPVAQVLGESCCLVKVVDLPKLLTEQRFDGAPPVHEPTVAVGPNVDDLIFVARSRPAHLVRPLPHGPPLLLLKRSFLI